ncbi:MAG: cation transporter [Synergistaceae bacterium]|nr:cation transporter [Synergistaceae bacterium]
MRDNKVQLVLFIILICNLAVSAIKIIVGLITGMQSITADGYHSVTDGLSNLIGMIGVKIASKPQDADHAYGHSRYETLASLSIAALLIYLGIKIIEQSVLNFLEPSFRIPSDIELALIIITLIFNIFVSLLESKAGLKLNSIILIADAKHTLSDIYVTLGVIASIILIKYFDAPLWIDAVISLLIAALIFKTAWQIFHAAADELTDHIAIEPEEIINAVMLEPEIKGVHKVRSRRSGNIIYADFHVQCDPEMKLKEVHAMTHRIQAHLREKLGLDIRCIIHTEDVK